MQTNPTPADIIDLISEAIDDSLDMDWRSIDAAKLVYKALVEAGQIAPAKERGTECPSSETGFHIVDTSMESGPNNCFHCERPMR